MAKKPIIRKFLVVGIVLLFIGVTIAEGFSANIMQVSRANTSTPTSSDVETTTVTCRYFTFSGVEQVEKELSVQDAVYLSEMMNTSDSTILASELHRYGLLPQTMNEEQATALLTSEYVQKELQQVKQLLPTRQVLDSDWMKNSLCSVSGYGVNSYYMDIKNLVVRFALVYALYLFVTLPASLLTLLLIQIFHTEIFMLLMLFFYIPQMIAEGFLWDGEKFPPFKLSPTIVVAELYDMYGHDLPYLNVSGIQGNWNISTYPGIGIYMLGFYGIWLSIKTDSNIPIGQVKGWCFQITAQGLDDTTWDGWDRHNWPRSPPGNK